MYKDEDKRLWELLEETRDQSCPDILSFMKVAAREGISVDLHTVREIVRRQGKAGKISPPDHIASFLVQYLRSKSNLRILDPWANHGELLIPLLTAMPDSTAVGINLNPESHEVAQHLFSNSRVAWKLGDPVRIMEELQPGFDVVVSVPPFNLEPKIKAVWQSTEGPVQIHDFTSSVIWFESLRLLNRGGTAFICVPLGLHAQSPASIYSNLELFGFYVLASVHLPPGTFAPATSIACSLLIVSTQPTSHMIVAELGTDNRYNETLVENIRKQTSGVKPQLGMLVDRSHFRSYQAEVNKREIDSIARKTGQKVVSIADVATEISLVPHTGEHEFRDQANAIYLPVLGTSAVLTSFGDFPSRKHSYIQIILDPTKAVAKYVAELLNKPLGLKARYCQLGNSNWRVNKVDVAAMVIPLPPLSDQSAILRVNTKLDDLQALIQSEQDKLWNAPRSHKSVDGAIQHMRREQAFVDWVEGLPFPLASILWHYQADHDPKKKSDHLLQFFEALTQFVATTLLSGFSVGVNLYKSRGERSYWELRESIQQLNHHPSFGTWHTLGRMLGKQTRALLSNEEGAAACARVFGSPAPEFLSLITDKELFALLDEARIYRNEWRGHVGILGPSDIEVQLSTLEELLAKTRKVIRDRFRTALLLAPGPGDFEKGQYTYSAHLLRGTRVPLPKTTVGTLAPMDKNFLYLLHEGESTPFRLMPFVRLITLETRQSACYFFNRISDDQVRWVSYHHEERSTVLDTMPEVTAELQDLIHLFLDQGKPPGL